jgi:hypothetical protein
VSSFHIGGVLHVLLVARNPSLGKYIITLTKEGSGEVLQWRASNLPLASSLVRRGFIGPAYSRRAGRVLGRHIPPIIELEREQHLESPPPAVDMMPFP